MGEKSLKELEEMQNQAYRNYYEALETLQASEEKISTLTDIRGQETMRAAVEALENGRGKVLYDENDVEAMEKRKEAAEVLREAEAARDKAEADMEVAAATAQAAMEALEKKKEELRAGREEDATHVVHTAVIECPYGMRDSRLALEYTHGVSAQNLPQMTVKDIMLNKNIINFGGCRSKENPKVQEAIAQVTREANERIEDMKDWRDGLVGFAKKVRDFFTPKKTLKRNIFGEEMEEVVEEEKISECIGECIAEFPADAEWTEGHEEVFINGEPVLLRKCSIMCNYKGCITILDSGQPK